MKDATKSKSSNEELMKEDKNKILGKINKTIYYFYVMFNWIYAMQKEASIMMLLSSYMNILYLSKVY